MDLAHAKQKQRQISRRKLKQVLSGFKQYLLRHLKIENKKLELQGACIFTILELKINYCFLAEQSIPTRQVICISIQHTGSLFKKRIT